MMLHKEKTEMDAREDELIRIIREHEYPQKAMQIAVDIILKALAQPLPSEGQDPSDVREVCDTTQ